MAEIVDRGEVPTMSPHIFPWMHVWDCKFSRIRMISRMAGHKHMSHDILVILWSTTPTV